MELLEQAELAEIREALRRFEDDELDAADLEALPVRLRAATFLCAAATSRLNPDGAWMGSSFASLVRDLFPGMRGSFVSNLGTELKKNGLKEGLKLGTLKFEVFFLTDQLYGLVGKKKPTRKAGPQCFAKAIERLQGEAPVDATVAAELLYRHGCERAATLLSVMRRSLAS